MRGLVLGHYEVLAKRYSAFHMLTDVARALPLRDAEAGRRVRG